MLKLVRYRGRHAVTRAVSALPARALAIVAVVVMALGVPAVARATTVPTGTAGPNSQLPGFRSCRTSRRSPLARRGTTRKRTRRTRRPRLQPPRTPFTT